MDHRNHKRLLILALFCTTVCLPAETPRKGDSDFFETRVRPVLAKNCFACHTSSNMGGLQLDSREHLLQGGKDGQVVTPGDPDNSLLIQAVRQTNERFKMPPTAKLQSHEIEDLAAWVKAGAVWPETADQPARNLLKERRKSTAG